MPQKRAGCLDSERHEAHLQVPFFSRMPLVTLPSGGSTRCLQTMCSTCVCREFEGRPGWEFSWGLDVSFFPPGFAHVVLPALCCGAPAVSTTAGCQATSWRVSALPCPPHSKKGSLQGRGGSRAAAPATSGLPRGKSLWGIIASKPFCWRCCGCVCVQQNPSDFHQRKLGVRQCMKCPWRACQALGGNHSSCVERATKYSTGLRNHK